MFKKFMYLTFLFIALFILSCSNSNKKQEWTDPGPNDQAGEITISYAGLANAAAKSMVPSKLINNGKISSYRVTIVSEKNGTTSEILSFCDVSKKYRLNVQKNIAILVEPLDINQNSVLKGKFVAGYGEVLFAQNSIIDVNWGRTPMALVFNKMITDAHSVQNIDPSALQSAIDQLWSKSFLNAKGSGQNNYFNPITVDSDTMAADLLTNPASTQIRQFSTSSITITLSGYSQNDLNGMRLLIDEPLAAPASATSIPNQFTFSNIAPGNWTISLLADSTGSTDVIVPTTASALTGQINKVNNRPVLYDWCITAFNDNGTKKAIASAFVGDEDADALQVNLNPSADNLLLADSASSVYYDALSNDRVFETTFIPSQTAATYNMVVSDGMDTDNQSKAVTLSYLGVPDVTSITEGQVLNNAKTPVNWNAVAGATYYTVRIYQGSNNLIYAKDLSSSTTSYTPTTNLPNGNYVLELYAHTNSWLFPYTAATSYAYMNSMSCKRINFTINDTGTVNINPNFGSARNIYHISDNKIYSYSPVTSTSSVIYTPAVSDAALLGMSPDGMIVLVQEGGNLYKIRGNGSKFLLFGKVGESVKFAKWSAKGGKIAVVTYSNTIYQLYVINNDGNSSTLIGTVDCPSADFSPDDARVFYYKSKNLYQNLSSGSNESLVHKTGLSETIVNAKLEVSPNGSRILMHGRIYSSFTITVGLDGTNPRTFSVPSFYNTLTWSPDNGIAYTDTNYLYLSKDSSLASFVETKVISNGIINSFAFSPDFRIYFQIQSSGSFNYYLYSCNALALGSEIKLNRISEAMTSASPIYISPMTW